MPGFRTLSEDEIARRRRVRAPRPDLLQPYVDYIKDLAAGAWSELQLEASETQRAVKRRLTTAAKQLGKRVKYRKGADGAITFELQTGDGGQSGARTRGARSGGRGAGGTGRAGGASTRGRKATS